MKNENIKKMNIHYMLWYFFIFSIVGLIMETIFCYLTMGILESRKGFIISPICPVYGVGAVIIIYTLQFFKDGLKEVAIISTIVGSAIEYILSFILEAMYGNRFWDYSYLDFDINGRICLKYSIYWMLAGIIVVKVIKPIIDKVMEKMPQKKIRLVDCTLFAFLVFDALITVWGVNTYTDRAIQKYDNTLIKPKTENSKIIKIKKEIGDKIFSDKLMLKTFPNIRIRDKKNKEIYIKDIINLEERI